MKKLMVAGMHSGSGKTTVTMGLLRLLMQEGKRVQVYKTGPDYIDPVFHSAVSGRPCINLDPWFLGADGLRGERRRQRNICGGFRRAECRQFF